MRGCVSARVSCFIKMIYTPSLAVKIDARRFKDEYVIMPHIHSLDGSSKLRFWKCRNADHYKTWTKSLGWQNYTEMQTPGFAQIILSSVEQRMLTVTQCYI